VAIAVAEGQLAFGLTDTDDAITMIDESKPVAIVYPDSRADQMGTLFIPNTLSLVKGAPNPDAGKQLMEYLLSAEVEAALATGPSAQIPLNREVNVAIRVKTPKEIHAMDVDFAAAATAFAVAGKHLEKHFLVD
jgi:iron(III) transport system substrate-binding protein